MIKLKKVCAALGFLAVLAFSSTKVFAQNQAQPFGTAPSFDVILQLVSASNASQNKSNLPKSLSGVAQKLQDNYSFSSYRLESTYLERTAENGSIDFKSVSAQLNSNTVDNLPVFNQWSLGSIKSGLNKNGGKSVECENFRFWQRVPVKLTIVNYEQIGLTLQKFSLLENTPTGIGSFSMPSGEMMFLILTVRPLEE